MSTLRLKLFVSGPSKPSRRAREVLERLQCEGLDGLRVELTTVDVDQDPDVAEQERILATPALVKQAPLPRRHLVGDLSDRERVLRALGVTPASAGPPS